MYPSALMHSSPATPPASCRPASRLSAPFFPPLRLLLLGLLLGLLLFVLATPFCAAATTYYVSPAGNDSNAGTQAAPFHTIQTAINNAVTGDTVTLADGTYTGPGDVDLDMSGKSLTINSMSGDPTTTTIDCGGTSAANHRAFYFHSNESATVITGLTMQHSYEGGNDANGGAVAIGSSCTVTLTNCNFSSNNMTARFAASNGGGMSNYGIVTLNNCNFSNNTADSGQGGGYVNAGGFSNSGTATLTGCKFNSNTASAGGVVNNGMATLTNCTVSNNSGTGVVNGYIISLTNCTINNNIGGFSAGGFSNKHNAVLTNCVIAGNSAQSSGAGVSYASSYSSSIFSMTGCTVSNNVTTNGSGGGIYSPSAGMTLTSCIISNNKASRNGGGIDNSGNSTGLMLTNCLLTGNTASSGSGGGVENEYGGIALLQFCTFSTNNVLSTGQQGGAVENDGTATLTDDIFWGNIAPYEAAIGIATTGNPVTTVTYSDIQGGLSGMGNIKVDPLFVNPTNDFHLTVGSPCLHTGIAITGITTDLDGKTRADPPSRGCYENVGVPVTNGVTTLASSQNPSIFGQNVTFTATVTVTSGSLALAGNMQFAIDGVNVNSPVPLSGSGAATATTNPTGLTAGTHIVTATYSPTNAYAGTTLASLTQVVNALAASGTLALTSSLNPSVAGQSVTFTATITFTGNTPTLAGTMQFSSDGVNINGPATLTSSNGKATATAATTTLTAGTHHITATFTPAIAFTGGTVATITQIVAAISHTHVLWNNTDGKVMLWSIAQDGTYTQNTFGPYTDGSPSTPWHAAALATGHDGLSHILWTNPDGRVILWTVSDSGSFTYAAYGPYTDGSPNTPWSATALSVGADNLIHILWNNPDGRVILWNVDTAFNFALAAFGPYTDGSPDTPWRATAIATGPDNVSRVVWNNPNGRVILWNVDNGFNFTYHLYGPYTDGSPNNPWSVSAVSVGPDNMAHLLWANPDTRVFLWNVDGSFNFTNAIFGPYTDGSPNTPWGATALATGPENLSHLLWTNPDNRVIVWGVDSVFNFTYTLYGPFTDGAAQKVWAATAISAGP